MVSLLAFLYPLAILLLIPIFLWNSWQVLRLTLDVMGLTTLIWPLFETFWTFLFANCADSYIAFLTFGVTQPQTLLLTFKTLG